MRNARRHRRGGDFWWEWQQEWDRIQGKDPQVPPFPPNTPGTPQVPPFQPGTPGAPPEMQTAWREFFQRFTGASPETHWAFGGRRFHPWHQGDVQFNPFVANLFSQGGGLLPLVVLRLLADKPRYGNELMSLISEKTSGQWMANPGAIYPLMTELENRGLVQGEWEDPRKRTVRIYKLTEYGKREVERVKAIVRPKLEEAIEVMQTIVSDMNTEDETDRGDKA